MATLPSRAGAADSSAFFSTFRSICLESAFDTTSMEAKARAIGFVSAGAGSESQGVSEAKILVLGSATAPELVLLFGHGLDYGELGVLPEATLCAVSSFKADALALSSALTWVGPVQPVQSAQGFSVYMLDAAGERLPPLILRDKAALEAATASGRLVILIVGGDEKTTSLSITRLKKAMPPS